MSLIQEAWATTWRSRFLWILGLFAGVTGGTMSVGRMSLPSDADGTVLARQVEQWLQANASVLVGLAVVGAATGLLLAVLSVIARGGITQATLDLQSGQPMSLRAAWRAGTRWFWRFLGLLVVLGVVAACVVGASVLAWLALGGIGVAFAAVTLTVGAIASIVLAYAERAIVSHDLGPLQALRYGWSIFERNVGASLLAWIVSVGISAVAGIAAGVAIAGLSTVGVIVALIAIAAIANTFFWSYWTVAYLRLDARPSTS